MTVVGGTGGGGKSSRYACFSMDDPGAFDGARHGRDEEQAGGATGPGEPGNVAAFVCFLPRSSCLSPRGSGRASGALRLELLLALVRRRNVQMMSIFQKADVCP